MLQKPPGQDKDRTTQCPTQSVEILWRWDARCWSGTQSRPWTLTRYMDERFCAAPPQEQEAFRRLLEIPDPVIYAYCLGSERPPEQLAVLIEGELVNPGEVAPNLQIANVAD